MFAKGRSRLHQHRLSWLRLNTETSGVLASHRHTCCGRTCHARRLSSCSCVELGIARCLSMDTFTRRKLPRPHANHLLPRCSCAASPSDAPIRRGPARSSGEKASCRHPSGVDRAGTLQPGTPELPPAVFPPPTHWQAAIAACLLL